MTPRTNIDSIHTDICTIEKWLLDAATEEAKAHYGRLLAEQQKRLREACAARASFYRR